MFEGELLNWFVHGGPPSLIEPSQRTGACQLRPYHFDRTMPRFLPHFVEDQPDRPDHRHIGISLAVDDGFMLGFAGARGILM